MTNSPTMMGVLVKLPTGKYTIALKNLDTVNAITVAATYDTVSSIA